VNDGNPLPPPGPPSSPPAQVRCFGCAELIDARYEFCPHCGRSQGAHEAWYYHPVWILFLALVAIGPFALFLVWKSQKMTRTAKAVMAAVILVYTGFCVYYFYAVVAIELNQLRGFTDIMRQIELR